LFTKEEKTDGNGEGDKGGGIAYYVEDEVVCVRLIWTAKQNWDE
jgi:hypothetical protein